MLYVPFALEDRKDIIVAYAVFDYVVLLLESHQSQHS
jgi:hypothetical protein